MLFIIVSCETAIFNTKSAQKYCKFLSYANVLLILQSFLCYKTYFVILT